MQKQDEIRAKLEILGDSRDPNDKSIEFLDLNRKISNPYGFEHGGLEFIVHPNVFAPDIFEDTFFYMDAISWRPGNRFLEIGCGAGLIAIKAALSGCKHVLATDINPFAVANTNANVEAHNLQALVAARQSDVFSNVEPTEKFDQIFWNYPFIWSDEDPVDELQASLYDKHYGGLRKYLRSARDFLHDGGVVMLGFSSSSGHFEAIELLCEEQNFSVGVLNEKIFEGGFRLQLLSLS